MLTRYQLIDEFARLRDVPVMKAGIHNGEEFDDARLERMARNTNAAMPYIQESITVGAYRDNPELVLTKPIPGVVNLNHQMLLPETFRDAVKGATLSLKTQMIDGVKWLVATVDGLKSDVAHFLANRHPFRSVEIIPALNVGGKVLTDVVRSIGFLSPDMPPAVAGQTPRLLAEYAEDGMMIVISEFAEATPEYNNNESQEATIMPGENKSQKATIMPKKDESQTTDAQAVNISEFMEMKELVAKLQEQMALMQETLAAATEAKETAESEKEMLIEEAKQSAAEKAKLAADAKMKEEELMVKEKALQQAEVKAFCDKLVHEFHASPAFMAVAQPLIEYMDTNGVKEFAGKSVSPRDAVKTAMLKLIDLSAKNAVIVPIGEYAAAASADAPDARELLPEDQHAAVIATYMERAKKVVTDPTDEKQVYYAAASMAIKNNYQPAA